MADKLIQLKDGNDNMYPTISPYSDFLSVATNASTFGFRIRSAASSSYCILYFDQYGRVGIFFKTVNGTPYLTPIVGTFGATSSDSENFYLYTGNWVRGGFLLTSANKPSISITAY